MMEVILSFSSCHVSFCSLNFTRNFPVSRLISDRSNKEVQYLVLLYDLEKLLAQFLSARKK